MPDSDLETRMAQLAGEVVDLRTRFDELSRGCTVKHVELNRRAETLEEDVSEHDRSIDLLRSELEEHGRVLAQVSKWVERWGMETTSLGRTLEAMDERQALTSQTTQVILGKMGEVMDAINVIAARKVG